MGIPFQIKTTTRRRGFSRVPGALFVSTPGSFTMLGPKKTQSGNDSRDGGDYRETAPAGTAAGLSDGQLLERFLQGQDESAEAAFAALVDRHGAMVLRICRQVLGNEHDAQDASQATFLVLARRAGSIGRRESVASWLHGVALRVAARARLAASRREARERRGGR
jgi:Sigma-70 region 2